jgi:hypothetical protein
VYATVAISSKNIFNNVAKCIDISFIVYYNATMNEIDLIKQYIKRNGLTNKEFAQLIGYDRVSWQKIKSGIVPLNKHFIKNVERAIPDIFFAIKGYQCRQFTECR